jgi:hypothetical protein
MSNSSLVDGLLEAKPVGGGRYDLSVKKPERTGNWSPDGKAERAAAQRDFRELTPAKRAEQVFELSRIVSQLAEAGRRQRSA